MIFNIPYHRRIAMLAYGKYAIGYCQKGISFLIIFLSSCLYGDRLHLFCLLFIAECIQVLLRKEGSGEQQEAEALS